MVPAPPSEPEPGPGVEFPVPPQGHGAQGTEWALAVCSFPTPTLRGVLWDAVFTYGRQTFGRGPATIDVTVPATESAMRILGLSTPHRDQHGRTLYRFDPLRIELAVTVDGKVTDRYVVRGDVTREGGMLRFTGHTHDKLIHERVLGPANRRNSLNGVNFDASLSGWQTRGGASMTAVAGGPSGTHHMRLTGPVGSYAFKTARMTRPTPQEGRQAVRGSVLVNIPSGDWDRYAAVSINVRDRVSGRQWWPMDDGRDSEFGLIDGAWRRDVWLSDEVTARGWLPPAPFDAYVELRLMALGPSTPIKFAQPVLWRRGHTGTDYDRDLIYAPIVLLRNAQVGRDKSTWNIECIAGTPTGVEETVTWWHGDKRSLIDCLSDVLDREDGPEVWFDGSRRAFRSSARRGAVRTDIIVFPWDVLGGPRWEQDSAAQKSQLHAVSAASSVFGGADIGVTDTSHTSGQIIEVVAQGPAGKTPNALRQWARQQLARSSIAPTTASLPLRWELGRRIAVGDQIRVVQANGSEVSAVWMRATGWRCDPQRRVVTVDFGNDPNEED